MEDNVERINMTPSWEGILPLLLSMLEVGTHSQAAAKNELRRMAVLADKYVALRKLLNEDADDEI
jgi:hypothetical protein